MTMMEWKKVPDGYRLMGAAYDVLFTQEGWPAIQISFDGRKIADLPLHGAVDRDGFHEQLTNFTWSFTPEGGILLKTQSSLWEEHGFLWSFQENGIRFRHLLKGEGRLDRCYFVSSGESDLFALGSSYGFFANSQFYTQGYFSPAVNLANRHEFDIGEPNAVGLTPGEAELGDTFVPAMSNDLFVPPLCYVFHTDSACMGIGIGARPGKYRFNDFRFSGVLYAGGAFWVDYLGYTSFADLQELPELFLCFNFDPYAVLQDYVKEIDLASYGTSFTHPRASWHNEPIFCGWSCQTSLASRGKERLHARDLCTQENYEKWLKILEDRGIDYGTLVIDDKWMKHYGTFTVDEEKWPDMKGFIRRCHEKGHHVLLWAPVLFTDGVPKEQCILDSDGNPLKANLANGAYATLLRENFTYLIRDLDADGFKEDLINCGMTERNLPGYGKYHGLEMLAAFQRLLYTSAHEAKADALVETQTPNPMMRSTSDMLRLNDLWYGAHNVPEIMRIRARIAKIAGWRLIDCDDGGASGLKEWLDYARIQPELGVPSLYFAEETEATHERPTSAHWAYLADLWANYRRSHVSDAH